MTANSIWRLAARAGKILIDGELWQGKKASGRYQVEDRRGGTVDA